MKRLVVDTNVVVSAFLRSGHPAKVVATLGAGAAAWLVDGRILGEYEDVLRRPKLRLSKEVVDRFLVQVADLGVRVVAAPLPLQGPDGEDRPCLEVALTGRADALVTGNGRLFTVATDLGLRVLSPAEWVRAAVPSGA